MVSGPDLGVRPGPNLYFQFIILCTVSNIILSFCHRFQEGRSLKLFMHHCNESMTPVAGLSSLCYNFSYFALFTYDFSLFLEVSHGAAALTHFSLTHIAATLFDSLHCCSTDS